MLRKPGLVLSQVGVIVGAKAADFDQSRTLGQSATNFRQLGPVRGAFAPSAQPSEAL